MQLLQRLSGSLTRLLWDDRCPLCQRHATAVVCVDCDRQLQQCRWKQPLCSQQPAVWAWGNYDGPLRQAIATLKYQNQPSLARPLGQWMGTYWRSTVRIQHQTLVVVPVPMFTEKQKERGFNQAERLATAFCEVTQLPIARSGLVRVRNTRPQFELSQLERQQNLVDAFELGAGMKRRSRFSVVLLDDIYTTGATARAAIATLAAHHIPVAMVVVLAQSRRNGCP
jgi:ComF family protein